MGASTWCGSSMEMDGGGKTRADEGEGEEEEWEMENGIWNGWKTRPPVPKNATTMYKPTTSTPLHAVVGDLIQPVAGALVKPHMPGACGPR